MSFWRKAKPAPADTLHSNFDWVTADQLRSLGHPVPETWWQRRPPGPRMVRQPIPVFVHTRGPSRGSDAYAPQFGYLAGNPIGGATVTTARLPTIAGPSARYEFGAIFFAPQTIPTTVRFSTVMSQESVNALLSQTDVTATYLTTG